MQQKQIKNPFEGLRGTFPQPSETKSKPTIGDVVGAVVVICIGIAAIMLTVKLGLILFS